MSSGLAVDTLLVVLSISWTGPLRAAYPGQSSVEPAPWVKPAVDGVLDLFKQKSVVALGDAHGLAQEEALYSALVRDPRFASEVGNVVVEFGGQASQGIIDRYVSAENIPPAELRRVWTTAGGWVPGPTSLGYVNFFANVRAANLKLPPEHRIKVWLGDPEVGFSPTPGSAAGTPPRISRRDQNFFRIISDEILKKQKKTLLIIGGAHLFDLGGPLPVSAMINEAYPHALAVVSPFLGYIEPECNAKVVAQAKDWPVPAIAGPVEGTWLKSELQLPGCSYAPMVFFVESRSNKPKKPLGALGPPPPSGPVGLETGKPPAPDEKLSKNIAPSGQPSGVQSFGPVEVVPALEKDMLAGAGSDAILYLGPPESLTQSPIDPDIYLDPDYFNEENGRARGALDWDQLLQANPVVPKKYEP